MQNYPRKANIDHKVYKRYTDQQQMINRFLIASVFFYLDSLFLFFFTLLSKTKETDQITKDYSPNNQNDLSLLTLFSQNFCMAPEKSFLAKTS